MMKLWVADASVACKWHFDEEDASLAKALLRDEGEIIAPDSFLSEFANAAGRKIRQGDIARQHAERAVREIPEQIARFVPSRELLLPALDMSVELRHPIYDCLYLTLAEREGAVLVTDDRAFIRKTADSRWRKYVVSLRDFTKGREE